MKKGFVVSVAFVLVALFSASMLLAQEKVWVEKEKGSFEKEMKLTTEQKAKMEELKVEHRMKAIDLRAEREKLGLMLKKEWMKPEPSAQELESLVKQMSAVREKLQMNTVQHMLAVRKLLGPDWRMYLKAGAGECCEMIGELGMPMSGGSECCPMMGSMMSPMAGAGGCSGMGEKRVIRIVGDGPGAAPDCMMGKRGMGAMKSGCMMHKGCKGLCMSGRGGMMGGGCIMHQGSKSCCSSRACKSHSKMFRPFGKKGCCSSQSGCMMGKQGMGGGCGTGAMMGGCMMQQGGGCKGGMKAGCMGTSSKKVEVLKEGTCPLEMKKEAEKKELEKKK